MTQVAYVIDASALLAAIHNEAGGDYVQKRIEHCTISSVNWSEVLQKLEREGADTATIEQSLKALGLEIADFTEEDAQLAASLWPVTKELGLSLADRACLATGMRLQKAVITADQAWEAVNATIKIELIR